MKLFIILWNIIRGINYGTNKNTEFIYNYGSWWC